QFIDRHGGIKAFQWKPPLEPVGLYRCDEHKLTPLGGDNYSLSLTFTQAFKP
ncbi:phage tail protein, partial [Morganella sp. HMSC11D09]